ncbi:fimbrial biogenesis chaperone [Acinetobacter larvae]|uniref:Pilus assembly protein n=1 Tax=Acinetobacter larvae TaxID=1789224 RepID=A0A1B2M3E4_9GAMM|nr:molecular chaperone [Acinetobacter larvae]AOA59720.1 pilus assembly protein [Acinetobacter larvae]
MKLGWRSLIGAAIMVAANSTPLWAGVVLTGTRIIFADGQKEKTIYLQNKDSYPNLVQIWLDEGDENLNIENSSAPFVVGPQIFRIQPDAVQTVRLRFLGQDQVPQDRESLFYMNFSETPALKKSASDANRLVVVFKNRIKVFYRPKQIVGQASELSTHLQFKLHRQDTQTVLQIHNNSAYFANVKSLSLVASQHLMGKGVAKALVVKENEIIAPKSTVQWPVAGNLVDKQHIRLSLVNDYGVLIEHELPLQD